MPIVNNCNMDMLIGNNLYWWAMSQFMPLSGFKWVEPTLDY
jgi:hypothetical protein